MSEVAIAMRMDAFALFVDGEGPRRAIRLGSVLVLSDDDSCQYSTLMQIMGGRVVSSRAFIKKVLSGSSKGHLG